MNEDFSEIIAAVKKFAVDNLSLSTLSDEELEEQIKTITDNMIGNRYVSIKNRVDIAQQVFSSIRGFGLLDTIMNDDTITEVMINGADNIFIEQAGRVKRLDESFESQRKLEDIIQRIVGKAGREVNQSNPIVDTRLPDGSRVNVVLPPIALCGPTVTIRKFSKTPMTIEKLISYGSITREIADKLKLLVEAKYNIFICGGTGSGKTTFLNALSNYIPKDERVITIEDSAELQIKGVDNLVSLETRNANASGAGAVTIRELIKSSLRMRPERIVVGEVRGGEALDMLQAMNTGHDGSLSTGHANSTQDMLSRLETMVLQGADGLPLKKADVEALRDKVIIVNKEFYQDILDRIKSLKYCGNKLAEKYDSSKVEKADYEKDFKKSKIMPDTVDSNGMAAAINSAKANFESDTGNSFKAFCRLLENDEFSTKSGFTTKAQEENQQFFEYLASNFEYKSGTEEEEKSEASDGGKEALIDKGKVTSAKENAKNDKTLSGDVSSDFLDAMVTNNSKSQQDIGVDPTDPEGSSDDNVTDTADSMSGEETTSFLEAVGNIAATGRDKLYLVEYMRNMFSCYTTNLDPSTGKTYEDTANFERTLSNIVISEDNNLYYGGECEYILWGGTPSSAVNKTKASIFGIRFILNLIYAMSAPDINALTFEWATVIAGWTVFGVPIVQTVLKIALALAESAYDLNQLCLGKSVPLYKSSTTWAMSPQGMIGIAKDAATELIENAAQAAGDKLDKLVTNIFDTIGNTANDKIKDLEGTVNNYIEQTKNSITDQVINATVTPFLNSVKGIVGKIDSNWGEEKIKEELNASLEKLKENSTDDIFGKCKTLAIEYLQGKVDKVTSTIYQNLSSTTENMANETMKQVKGLFYSENSTPGYIEELTEQLKAKVNELSSKLQENVTNALNSTEDNVKEKLNSALTDFTDKVSGTVSSGLDKVGEAAPDNNTVGDVTNAKAATISLNYKEYLYAFMLIGILANEDNMIARTGYLMQMNISQKMTDAGFDDSDRENFDMTKMYTMVQIHSEADVDSVFMGMFEKKTVNGEESYSLNFDGDGSSTDRLVYNGFIGY